MHAQAYMYAFFQERSNWTPLPNGINLLTAFYAQDHPEFLKRIRKATLIHYVGVKGMKVMLDRLTLTDDGSTVLGTTDGDRGSDWGVLDFMWIDAWTATRRILQLPMQEYRAPVARMVSEYYSMF
jgi:hypothetical protein